MVESKTRPAETKQDRRFGSQRPHRPLETGVDLSEQNIHPVEQRPGNPREFRVGLKRVFFKGNYL